MEIFLALALLALLLLPRELLPASLSWPGRAEPGTSDDVPAEPPAPSRWDLFSGRDIQRRLDALADELDRLDTDPGVYARGFRMTVARTAYEALLADAADLAEQRATLHVVGTLDVELLDAPVDDDVIVHRGR